MLRPSRGGHEQFNAAEISGNGLRLFEFGRPRRYGLDDSKDSGKHMPSIQLSPKTDLESA